MLPCPVCAVSVAGANLEKHLNKVHPGHSPTSGGLSWRGADMRVSWLFGGMAAAGVIGIGLLVMLGGSLTWVDAVVPVMGLILVALPLIALSINLLRPMLPARVTLDGDRLRLRYALGALTRTVTLPATIEIGSLKRRTGGAHMSSYAARSGHSFSTHDVSVGSYLRISTERTSLIIGCPRHTGIRKHWKGWRPGGKRRMWDITLAPSDFVALQYQLAARGPTGSIYQHASQAPVKERVGNVGVAR